MTTTAVRRHDEMALAFAAGVGPDGPVAVEGGRTRWGTGGPGATDTRLVRAPAGIIDYQPEEMIVRVRAGTTVADLERVLGEAGQRSALPCRSGEATVGGALAVGENHLDVSGRGRVRDCLLQVTYVSAEGRLVTGGGPTVKNVSGFNLPRVMVGSLGTLGLLTEVILRVNPRPAAERWVRLDVPATGLRAVQASVLRPAAILTDGTGVWVHLEGHLVDVDAEHEALTLLGPVEVVDGPPPLPPHRWSVTPGEVLSPSSAAWGAGPYVAGVGVGTVWAATPAPHTSPASALHTVARRLKDRFDPSGRLNPGRWPGAPTTAPPTTPEAGA